MFVPKSLEQAFSFVQRLIPGTSWRYALVPFVVITVVIGSGVLLREVTLESLPFASTANVTLVSMLPEDNPLSANVLMGITKDGMAAKAGLLPGKDYLGYMMPVDYIMQGMIADTGSEFHLYKQHHTFSMINEWVLHPFQHLRSSPSLHMAQMLHVDPAVARRHHCPIAAKEPNGDFNRCSYRRVVLVEIRHDNGKHLSGAGVFSLNTTRVPVSFVDINARTGEVVNIARVQKATAWEDVPTPGI